MATYEIRTLKNRGRMSLLATGEYPHDIIALVEARCFMRPGETVEVWRDDKLIYRVTPRGNSDGLLFR